MLIKKEQITSLLTVAGDEVTSINQCPVGSQVLHPRDQMIVGIVMKHLENQMAEIVWSAAPRNVGRDRSHQGILVIDDVYGRDDDVDHRRFPDGSEDP